VYNYLPILLVDDPKNSPNIAYTNTDVYTTKNYHKKQKNISKSTKYYGAAWKSPFSGVSGVPVTEKPTKLVCQQSTNHPNAPPPPPLEYVDDTKASSGFFTFIKKFFWTKVALVRKVQSYSTMSHKFHIHFSNETWVTSFLSKIYTPTPHKK